MHGRRAPSAVAATLALVAAALLGTAPDVRGQSTEDPLGDAADHPRPVAENVDPLDGPFLCVIPPEPEWASERPEEFLRASIGGQAGVDQLMAVVCEGGVMTARAPRPGVVTLHSNPARSARLEQVALLTELLAGLSPKALAAVTAGEAVDVTAHRDLVLRLLGAGQVWVASVPGDPPIGDVARSAAGLVLTLEAVPAWTLREARPDGTPGHGLYRAELDSYQVNGEFEACQLSEDGGVCWTTRSGYLEHGGVLPAGWREGGSVMGAARLAAAAPAVRAWAAYTGATVCLSALSGTTVGEFIEGLNARHGLHLTADQELASRPLYGVGGDVALCDALEAVAVSAWCELDDDTRRGGRTLKPNWSGPPGEARYELADADREAAQIAALERLVVPCFEHPALASLPVPLRLFLDGYTSAFRDLPDATRAAIEALLADAGTGLGVLAERSPSQWRWLLDGDYIVELAMKVRARVSVCVPYRGWDSEAKEWVESAPPDRFFSDLGASRERPVYSVRDASFTAP